jgi:superfamily II DNA or RNA helicase
MLAYGELVEARGEKWIVTRHDRFAACAVVALEGVGHNAGRHMKLIEPFDRLRVLRGRLHRRSRRHVLRIARSAIAGTRPAIGLWSAAHARITVLPYQLEPALAVLGGATRLLLADAVGLGKTIQAGLVLAELRVRGLADRALVVTPAGLRHAWAAELRERFGLAPFVLDQPAIASQSWIAATEVNPWTCHDLVVASIDFVKRPDVIRSVEAAHFDLLIADEAHHLTPGSDRGAAIARLARRSPWVILASATPHSGDESAFACLKSIGAQNDRLAVFRRTRADAGLSQSRRTCLVAVAPTQEEAATFDAINRYTDSIWRARGAADSAVRLVAMTLRRRAASSATALLRTLLRRHALLGGEIKAETTQPALPWEDVEDGDADAPDLMLAAPGLNDAEGERQHLDRLVQLAHSALAHSSKIDRVGRIIARVREPALVFTEYRDTLEAVIGTLGSTHTLAAIHGGLPIECRRDSIDRFTRGGANVLVATDAAGEGLNLQNRCRLVVNMELPWNPLRLEQRIGRVDRIGQTRRVHAIHLFHRATVEETVLARLERRRLRAAIGLNEPGEWWSETDIATAVFDQEAREPRPSPHVSSLRVPHAAAEARRVELQRAFSRRTVRDGPVWTPPRHAGRASPLISLSSVRHVGLSGLTIEESVEAATFDLVGTPANRRDWRQLIEYLDRRSVNTADVDGRDQERLYALERSLRPFRTAVMNRLDAIRLSLARARTRPWQGSLFDRRLELDEERRLGALDAADARIARTMALVAGLTPDHEQIYRRLIAAWPLGGAELR